MGTWSCPHCRTVQADSATCFLCGRSATSCGTCVNFRGSVVGGVGFCGLDRRREPLTGEERRACWAGAADVPSDGVFESLVAPADSLFVELRPARTGAVRPVTGR